MYASLFINTKIEALKAAEILAQHVSKPTEALADELYKKHLANLNANHLYPELRHCGEQIADDIREYRQSDEYTADPEADLDIVLYDTNGTLDWIYEGVDDETLTDPNYAHNYLSEYFSVAIANRAKAEGYI